MLASMLGHNESYSKMVCYSHEASDKLQAVEEEKDEVEAILSLALTFYAVSTLAMQRSVYRGSHDSGTVT